MATPKSLRTPPPRLMANYTVSIKKLNGNNPISIPDSEFLESNFGGSSTTLGTRLISKPLGFTVNLDGISYNEFYHYSAGWMFLKDPARSFTGSASPWLDLTTSTTNNTTIKSNFTYNHLLLAPWFDSSSAVAKTIESLTSEYSSKLTADVIEKVKQGADTRNWPYDYFDYSVRYANSYDADKGRCLIVRWTNSELRYGIRFKFESVVFENGSIEFRYWPAVLYEQSDNPPVAATATAGIFSGASIGSNKFRDLSPLMDYRKEERVLSELGGAKYDSGFTENSKPYANEINTSNWPKKGAVITLTPPKNSVLFLPRKIIKNISNSKKIQSEPGLFDDRKTITYGSNELVHYPSTLPNRLLGDTSGLNVPLLQLLFTSGSIRTTGSVNKDAVEGLLSQIDALENSEKRINNSFNESQKDYSCNTNESAFYATGSSLENFGEGFNSPLKSKTQFVFSFPINRQTEMPSLTSSFYYYDQERKQWTTPYISGAQSPKPAFVLGIEESDSYCYYRVTETSLGFDAVGRKIVSGSSTVVAGFSVIPPANSTLQSDPVIGTIYNQSSGFLSFEQTLNDSALTKEYQNSLTDSEALYPKNYHQINTGIDYPFLIEKIVAEIPIAVSGTWFEDITTCNRAYGDGGVIDGYPSGAIDFGGPGLTFAIHCPRRGLGGTYLDLIASGTITHQFDDKKEVILKKDADMNYYSLRPAGFRSFSNPTTVVSGVYNGSTYSFAGSAILEMEASVAGGITFARNDRSLIVSSSNREKALDLITKQKIPTRGESNYRAFDFDPFEYEQRSPRVYIQQVSPLARGTSGFQFSGNSILGNSIAPVEVEKQVNNPLYISESGSLTADIKSKIDLPSFVFDAVSSYTTVDSRPSPYLLLPGDKLSFSISKTRPVIEKFREGSSGISFLPWVFYDNYSLSGSHGNFILNTGSIDITIYGSYVREGREFNP